MTYAVPTSGSKPRPAVVTAASILLLFGALAVVGYAISEASIISAVWPVIARQNVSAGADPSSLDAAEGAAKALLLTMGVLLAAGLSVLGVFVGRGKNPARITTWAVDGLIVLCCGCSNLSALLPAGTVPTSPDTGGLSPQEIDEAYAASPAWASITVGVLSVAILLTQLVVIILLALPASNEYFRRPAQVWVPPTAVGGQPPYPGYPPAPGYPPSSSPRPPAPPEPTTPPEPTATPPEPPAPSDPTAPPPEPPPGPGPDQGRPEERPPL